MEESDQQHAMADGYHRLDAVLREQAGQRAEIEAEALVTLVASDMGWPPHVKRAVVATLHLSHESMTAPSRELTSTAMAASNAATLRWLLAPVERQPQQSTGERLVGRNDVAAIIAMRHSLSQLDATHGGGAVAGRLPSWYGPVLMPGKARSKRPAGLAATL